MKVVDVFDRCAHLAGTCRWQPVVEAQFVKKDEPLIVEIQTDRGKNLYNRISATACCDGWQVFVEGRIVFVTTEEAKRMLIPAKGEMTRLSQPMRNLFLFTPYADFDPWMYVVLPCATKFHFVDETYTAPAGHVLYENPYDVDHYTVVSPDVFARGFKVITPARMLGSCGNPSIRAASSHLRQ